MTDKNNLFCAEDHALLRRKMTKLDKLERLVLSMRFWDNLMIEEIAAVLCLPWNHVDDILENAFLKLRKELASDTNFSRVACACLNTELSAA